MSHVSPGRCHRCHEGPQPGPHAPVEDCPTVASTLMWSNRWLEWSLKWMHFLTKTKETKSISDNSAGHQKQQNILWTILHRAPHVFLLHVLCVYQSAYPVSPNSDFRIWCKIIKNRTKGMADKIGRHSYLASHWSDFFRILCHILEPEFGETGLRSAFMSWPCTEYRFGALRQSPCSSSSTDSTCLTISSE